MFLSMGVIITGKTHKKEAQFGRQFTHTCCKTKIAGRIFNNIEKMLCSNVGHENDVRKLKKKTN